ncbi:TUBD1 [Cordylochernes scorpioides]|uniref:Tubulin delta chain n=1 Tax=Cordylochernes scorpioides TaxID=51811 RepID=A0ABY6JXE1_9ARAC|nr:TUBD1 [Cordylochernes scorpioides]
MLNSKNGNFGIKDCVCQVVTMQLAKGNGWLYSAGRSSIQRQGAANNWACGYYRCQTQWKETVRELVRREVEDCDWLEGFFPLMSLAGGTGSGLGSMVTETLREDYPRTPILNHVVCPFYQGEVSVQSYNVVMSAASLTTSADGLVILENDQLLRVITQRLGVRDACMNDLNTLAAQQMASLYLPACLPTSHFSSTLGSHSCNPIYYGPKHYGDILAHCVPHPQYKLLGLRMVPQEPVASRPFSTLAWTSLVRSLRRMLLYGATMDGVKGWKLFGVRAFLHQYTQYGMEQEDFVESFARVEQMLASYSKLH